MARGRIEKWGGGGGGSERLFGEGALQARATRVFEYGFSILVRDFRWR